jgi:asparagine synthase (glutamine-hydrolysing)
MSGILAIHGAKRAIDPRALDAALGQMRHRGPDGFGTWIGKDAGAGVALGHACLAVVDGARPHPIGTADDALQIVVDGDFYEHARQRAELEARGHRFGTRWDAEVALHLYREKGAHCLHDLRGEFALAIWDGKNRQLFAARDRLGIKPLYYGVFDGVLYLASEAKAIVAAGAPLAWDDEAFFQACNLQYPPPDRSFFRGVSQVPPGHYLVATESSLRVLKYWDYDFPTDLPEVRDAADERAYVERFRELFGEAVRLRLEGDAPVAAYLSGGLDSCAIVATAMQHRSTPIDCFTISFEEEAYDELSVAKAVAEHTGAKLHSTRVTNKQLGDNFADAVWVSEMPAVNTHAAAKYILSRVVHDHGYRVTLTGEGADELAAGYPHFRADLFADLGEQGRGVSAADLAKLDATNALSGGILMPHGDTLPLDAARRLLGYVPAFLETKASFGFRTAGVLSDDFARRFAGRDCLQMLLDRHDYDGQLRGRDRLNQSIYLWTKVACAQYALRLLGDGTEMGNSIRGRLPFFDQRVVELGRQLPIAMKIKGTTEKYVIRAAMSEVLPDVVLKRQKHPFLAPRSAAAGLDSFLNDTLRSEAVRDLPFFDAKKLRGLLDGYAAMPSKEQMATDPVLTFIVSASVLYQRAMALRPA